MKRSVLFALVASLPLLASCGAPRWVTATYDQFPLNWSRAKADRGLIKVVAMVPGGGAIADAVGVELSRRGFEVISMASTACMVNDVDFKAIAEDYIPSRRNPRAMRELGDQLHARGVDAFVIVRAQDFSPRQHLGRAYWQSAHISIFASGFDERNYGGDAIAGGPWVNIHDRPMSPSEAAVEIVENLAWGSGAI